MRKQSLFFFFAILCNLICVSQVKVIPGDILGHNNRAKLCNTLGGDDKSFYVYRIRTYKMDTSYIIQKIDKATSKSIFSVPVDLPWENYFKIVNVQYACGKVYVFYRQYYTNTSKMLLYYKTVSSEGIVSSDAVKLIEIQTDIYNLAEFEIQQNPSGNKFLIKTSYKLYKSNRYKTDFALYGSSNMEHTWTKTIERNMLKERSRYLSVPFYSTKQIIWGGFLGYCIDDHDNIYFGIQDMVNKEEKLFQQKICFLDSSEIQPREVTLTFDHPYILSDISISTPNNKLIIDGFLKNHIEREGRDWYDCGMFHFVIDISTKSVTSRSVSMFDDKMLYNLESSLKKGKNLKYKMDYIFYYGDNMYLIGEQYREKPKNGHYGGIPYYWEYIYMDVIIGKINSNGQFEWVKNIPMRNYHKCYVPHLFKEYIAVMTNQSLYIMRNTHPDFLYDIQYQEYNPEDLKITKVIHGSSFAYSSINHIDGSMKHGLVFENDDFCFAPIQVSDPFLIPSENTEIFQQGSKKEIFIYREDRGVDRFDKVILE